MKNSWRLISAAVGVTMFVVTAVGCSTGEAQAQSHEGHETQVMGDVESLGPVDSPEAADEIRYWTCVMHPSVKMPDPGNCPVCQMELIPVYAGAGLTLTEVQKALIPIRTEPLEFRRLSREIRAVGSLEYNETLLAYASTRVSGWIEDLHVDFTGIQVRQGDQLLTIYSPELVAAQDEYLTALRTVDEIADSQFDDLRRTVARTVDAARSKLELYGLTASQIDGIRRNGTVQTTLPLYAPIGGTVIHKNVTKGQHVKRGANLFRIADLSSLWILADVYEFELPWVRMAQEVLLTADSMPGRTFTGHVTYIFPYLDAPTRTQKVKIEVSNRDGQLRPGMYVTARIRPTLAELYARESHPTDPYACPMHPWITSATLGECTICGMDLEATRPLREDRDAAGMESVWTCLMHPEVVADGPGECPICGMDLVQAAAEHVHVDEAPDEWTQPDLPRLLFRYACPDHPDNYSTAPGTCPIDGRPLAMTGEALAVPKTAVIDTGLRRIVFIDRGDTGYELVEVELGPEAWAETTVNGRTVRRRYYAAVSGLQPDDMVVSNGNFLLDSQTQLTGSAAGAYGGALGSDEAAPVHRH